jgi:hypothetical protein
MQLMAEDARSKNVLKTCTNEGKGRIDTGKQFEVLGLSGETWSGRLSIRASARRLQAGARISRCKLAWVDG